MNWLTHDILLWLYDNVTNYTIHGDDLGAARRITGRSGQADRGADVLGSVYD